MATPAIIGYERPDGKIESIYVHYDGYLAHTYQILKHRYLGREKIEALMNMGDLSVLGYNPEENPVGWKSKGYNEQSPEERISYCVSYAARGDKGCEKRVHDNEDKFLNNVMDSVVYIYLFKDGKWYYKYANGPWTQE